MGLKRVCLYCGIELLPDEVVMFMRRVFCGVCAEKASKRPDLMGVWLQLTAAVQELEKLIG